MFNTNIGFCHALSTSCMIPHGSSGYHNGSYGNSDNGTNNNGNNNNNVARVLQFGNGCNLNMM